MELIVILDRELAAHLARALAEHATWCRRNGVVAPGGLSSLLAAVTASSGQQLPELARSDVDGEPVAVGADVAARRLGLSVRTVRRMVADGRLASTRVGRRVLVPVAALAELAGQGGDR